VLLKQKKRTSTIRVVHYRPLGQTNEEVHTITDSGLVVAAAARHQKENVDLRSALDQELTQVCQFEERTVSLPFSHEAK